MTTTQAPVTWQVLAAAPEMPAEQAPARAELAAALHDPRALSLLSQAPAPEPVLTEQEFLAVLTADLLGWPVESVKLTAQVGRFARVDYQPVRGRDPDLILCLESGTAARAFHAAMADFQAMRRDRDSDLAAWYQRAKQAAGELLGPLYALRPGRAESAFVLHWALLVAAQGRRIADGLPGKPKAKPAPAPAPTLSWQEPINPYEVEAMGYASQVERGEM